MKKFVGFIFCLLFSFSIFALDGKQLYVSKACVTCHGVDGSKPILPNYPKLNGQNSDYSLQQLKDVKSGKRNNAQTAVMKPFVMMLSEEEMKAISDYLAKLQ